MIRCWVQDAAPCLLYGSTTHAVGKRAPERQKAEP